jgi:Ca2+-binding RTX toxin-like protein
MTRIRPKSGFGLALISLVAVLLVLPGVAQALPSSVKAPPVNFERDTDAPKPNGFTSADNSITHFDDSIGEGLQIYDGEPGFDGHGLFVLPDDAGRLIIKFDVPIKKISLAFGNDDNAVADPGDVAILTAWKGATLANSATVVMNVNDLPDQLIGFSGTSFRRVELVYARGDTPLGLTEGVDDIRVSPVCTIKGTNGNDRSLNGNAKSNSICGFEGNDRIKAQGKNDFAHGGGGGDRIKGGPGDDTLLGGSGGDVIRAQDGVDGNDTVYGGGGDDTCYLDALDNQVGCEEVILPV